MPWFAGAVSRVNGADGVAPGVVSAPLNAPADPTVRAPALLDVPDAAAAWGVTVMLAKEMVCVTFPFVLLRSADCTLNVHPAPLPRSSVTMIELIVTEPV